jgi:hypothetical protein
MKLAWLMEEFMKCGQKPVQIRMGRHAFIAFSEVMGRLPGKPIIKSEFMGVPVVCDHDLYVDKVVFIARDVIWTPT